MCAGGFSTITVGGSDNRLVLLCFGCVACGIAQLLRLVPGGFPSGERLFFVLGS